MTEEKVSPSRSDFKAQKINNGAWLPEIAEHIHAFCQRAHVEGIQPGNLQTYFAEVAQGKYGMDACEFWLVFENDMPTALACWQVLGLPHIAKVYCFGIYSWGKSSQPVELLADEFVKFGEKWRAIWWSADVVGKKVLKVLNQRMAKRGFTMKESGLINVVWRKQ